MFELLRKQQKQQLQTIRAMQQQRIRRGHEKWPRHASAGAKGLPRYRQKEPQALRV
ncbi:hypothetical protein [Paraburkholderia mimosarum]|uniref:hypothetical protein n=1 Tax=Paraburkholderia mimosarum TaxID=312026 RepID=UPI0012B59935|nr:hypothetical protein [Paraburkholderia mimosarum]